MTTSISKKNIVGKRDESQKKNLEKILWELDNIWNKISIEKRENIKNKVDFLRKNIFLKLKREQQIIFLKIEVANFNLKLARHFQKNNNLDEEIFYQAILTKPNFFKKMKGSIHRLLELYCEEIVKQNTVERKKKANISDPFNNPKEFLFDTKSGRYHAVKLLNALHFEEESKNMGHCLGRQSTKSYLNKIRKGDIEIFSFRGKDNISLITIEYDLKRNVINEMHRENDDLLDLNFNDDYYEDFLDFFNKFQKTKKDNGQFRKIKEIKNSELKNIFVPKNKILTSRGEILIDDFDSKNDFIIKIGKASQKTNIDKYLEVINKKTGKQYVLNEVARIPEDINENTKYFNGDLNESHLIILKRLKKDNQLEISGNLDLRELTLIENLNLPKIVGGYLYLDSLISFENLNLPKCVGHYLYLNNLVLSNNLVLPKYVGDYIDLSSLIDVEGLIFPESIGGSLNLNSLVRTEKMILPKIIGGTLHLNRLVDAENVIFPESIGGSLNLEVLVDNRDLKLPKIITGSVNLGGLIKIPKLKQLKIKGERIELRLLEANNKNAQMVFKLIDENREYLKKWVDWEDGSKNKNDVLDYLMTTNELVYGVFINKNIYVGNISTWKHKSGDNFYEIGYWIDKKYSGRGYISDAVGLLEKKIFNELGVKKIIIGCDKENIASKKIAKKNGYTLEKKIIDEKYSKYFGEWRTSLYFEKVKK